MDTTTSHVVRDLSLVPPEKRKNYEELNQKQAALMEEFFKGENEVTLTRQQRRLIDRLRDK